MKKQFSINFLTGMGKVLSLTQFPEYIYPKKGDLTRDITRMEKDAITFSKDFHSITTKEHGKVAISKP